MDSSIQTVLDLKHIKKVYGKGLKKVHALKGVDLTLREGRVLGLLGPNGAGKTTIIKIILGLQKPSSGEMSLWGGGHMTRELKENIGFLPEESYLYPFLTIRETVEFAAGLYSNSKEIKDNINPLLKLVGLEPFHDRRISECSKGMARRTAMAQALVHDPDLILFDEPTSGFDPIGIAEVKKLVKELKAQGKTILLCTHQLNDVEELCDDILLLYRGESIVSGELKQLLGVKQESFSVAPENMEKVNEFLKDHDIEAETFFKGDLEKFFIEKVKAWSNESS